MERITGTGTTGAATDDLANASGGRVIMPQARRSQVSTAATYGVLADIVQEAVTRAQREIADEMNERLAAAGAPIVDNLGPKPDSLDAALAQMEAQIRTADAAGLDDIATTMRNIAAANRAALVRLSQSLRTLEADTTIAPVIHRGKRKRSLTIRPDLDEAVLEMTGPRGYSEFVNDAVLMALQARGIDESLEDAAREYGPLTDDDRENGRQRYAEAQARAAARTRAAAGGPQ